MNASESKIETEQLPKIPNTDETEAIPRSTETAGETPESAFGMDTNQDAESGTEGFSNPAPATKRRNFIPIIAGAAAVALIAAGGIAFAMNQPSSESTNTEPAAVEQVTSAADEQKETGDIHITIDMSQPKVAGVDRDGMTPFIAHVKGDTDGVKDVDFYTALEPTDVNNSRFKSTFEGVKGEKYVVDIIDSVSAEGGIIHAEEDASDFGDGVLHQVTTQHNSFNTMQEYVAPETVTQEQIDEIMDQLADAVAKGDETLTGEKGQAVIDAAASNAAANPNIDLGKVTEKADLAKNNVSDTPTDTTGGSDDGRGSDPSDSNSGSGSSSSGSGSNDGSGSVSNPVDNSTPAPAPTPTPTPKPEPAPAPQPPVHTHSPHDVYRTETYVITPEQKTAVSYLMASDGTKFYDVGAGEVYCIDNDLSYSIKTEYKTTPAVTGTRDVYDHTECSTCGVRL